MRRGRLLSVLVGGALLLGSCGGVEDAAPDTAPASTERPPAEEQVESAPERAAAAEARAAAAEARAAEAERTIEESEQRLADAEERIGEAEEREATAVRRASTLQREARRLRARIDELGDALESVSYVIPTGVIEDGYHVGYLVESGPAWFSFDMAEILSDGTWKNVNPKIRTLPVDPAVNEVSVAATGTPIELRVEGQLVRSVAALDEQPVPAATAPVLDSDGLGVAAFGISADDAVAAIAATLGPPDEVRPTVTPGLYAHVWYGGAEDSRLWVHEEAGRFVGWNYSGGLDLATANGISVGSSAAQVMGAYSAARFGQGIECCSGDWTPDFFHFSGDPNGMRGAVVSTGYPDEEAEMALSELGYPVEASGLHEALARFQADRGLVVWNRGMLDTATWLALGLTLPRDPNAPVERLWAGVQPSA